MNRQLPTCKYGAQCYRRNPAHLAQFSHPDPVKVRPEFQHNSFVAIIGPCTFSYLHVLLRSYDMRCDFLSA